MSMSHQQQRKSKQSGSLKKLLSNLSIRKKSSKKIEATNENPSSSNHAHPLPDIPSSVWIAHVFLYLDRQSQNRLATASKDIYEATKELTLSWPSGRYKTKRPVVSLALSPDSTTLAVVYCRKPFTCGTVDEAIIEPCRGMLDQ
jgi:hypothetical protein